MNGCQSSKLLEGFQSDYQTNMWIFLAETLGMIVEELWPTISMTSTNCFSDCETFHLYHLFVNSAGDYSTNIIGIYGSIKYKACCWPVLAKIGFGRGIVLLLSTQMISCYTGQMTFLIPPYILCFDWRIVTRLGVFHFHLHLCLLDPCFRAIICELQNECPSKVTQQVSEVEVYFSEVGET